MPVVETYETEAKGIRILPGQWRPHYPFEQIAWISPPWPSQDYIWLDFPEAIFTDIGLLYLSHVNPAFPVCFPDLPLVPWRHTDDGLAFERTLPNGVRFGGSIAAADPGIVTLDLFISNESQTPLRNIRLQTCACLRGIKEFSEFTASNKYVRTPAIGWSTYEQAGSQPEIGAYPLGFRGEGPAIADLPVIVTLSNEAERLVAMSWYGSTISLVSNSDRPCMHADPGFSDLEPGQRAEIQGEVLFFEGGLEQFEAWFKLRNELRTA